MSDHKYADVLDTRPLGESGEDTDSKQHVFNFDNGGVPWPLLILYLSYLVLLTFYVLEFQLPDFLQQGPGAGGEPDVISIQ